MKTIMDLRQDLDNNKLTSEELFNDSKSKAFKYQDEFNSFVTIYSLALTIDSLLVLVFASFKFGTNIKITFTNYNKK